MKEARNETGLQFNSTPCCYTCCRVVGLCDSDPPQQWTSQLVKTERRCRAIERSQKIRFAISMSPLLVLISVSCPSRHPIHNSFSLAPTRVETNADDNNAHLHTIHNPVPSTVIPSTHAHQSIRRSAPSWR